MSEWPGHPAIIAVLREVIRIRRNRDLTPSDLDLPIAEWKFDSLDTLELCMDIETATGIELDPGELIDVASLNELVAAVAAKGSGTAAAPPRADRSRPLPLSFTQERIWSYSRQLADPSAYVLPMADLIEGPLDVANLRLCLEEIVRRHDIMRTTFPVVDGAPVQQVHPAAAVALPVIDVSTAPDPDGAAAEAILRQRLPNPDPAIGPLGCFFLIRMSDRRHVLVRLFHHMLWDRWSSKLFLDELGALYEARWAGRAQPARAPDPLQYADYAAWQHTTLQREGPVYREALAWWADHYRGLAASPQLPFTRPQSLHDADPATGFFALTLPDEAARRLSALQARFSTTLDRIWLTALVMALSLETGQADVVVGSYVGNRRSHWLRVIGDFSNTLALRFRCEPADTFGQLLPRVDGIVRAAEERGDITYERMSHDLAARGATIPEIRIIASVNPGRDIKQRTFANLEVGSVPWQDRTRMPWGFSLDLQQREDATLCFASFDARLYMPSKVAGFINRLCDLVDLVSDAPEATAVEIRLKLQA